MLDGVLDSAIFTLDVHVRYLEQRMAARLRVLEEGVSSKQQQPLATEKQHPLSAALPFILSALLFHCTVSTIALSQSQRADAVTSPETAGSDPRSLMNSRIKLPLHPWGGDEGRCDAEPEGVAAGATLAEPAYEEMDDDEYFDPVNEDGEDTSLSDNSEGTSWLYASSLDDEDAAEDATSVNSGDTSWLYTSFLDYEDAAEDAKPYKRQ